MSQTSGLQIDRQEWYRDLGHTPRVGQAALDYACDVLGKRYLCLFAFPRAGKSFGAARHVEPDILKPNNHGWIVAPKYEFGAKEFGYIWNDLNEMGILRYAVKKYRDVRGGNMYIEFPWGSFVQVVSADNPTSLRAEELDWIILAEASAIPDNVFDQHLYARVEKRGGKVLVPTTPKGKNWVYDRFRIPSLPRLRNGVENPMYDDTMWSAVLSADPALVVPDDPDLADLYEPDIYDPKTVETASRNMPTPVYIEQFGGGFASYAGQILPWEPSTMLVDPFTIPAEWTHIVGWDHGASPDPTAIMVGSYAPDGTLYWWGEIESKGDTTENHLRMLQTMLSGDGVKRPMSVCTVDVSAKQVRIELARFGITTDVPHDKQVLSGIIRMTALMNEGKWKVFRGRCLKWEAEAVRWEWDEKNPQKPAKGQSDHFLDASRYASLITVELPSYPAGPTISRIDPLARERERLWRPVRERWKAAADAAEHDQIISEVEDDPFEEEYITLVEDFDPD